MQNYMMLSNVLYLLASTLTLRILKPCFQKRANKLVDEVQGNKVKFDVNSSNLFYIREMGFLSNKM